MNFNELETRTLQDKLDLYTWAVSAFEFKDIQSEMKKEFNIDIVGTLETDENEDIVEEAARLSGENRMEFANNKKKYPRYDIDIELKDKKTYD